MLRSKILAAVLAVATAFGALGATAALAEDDNASDGSLTVSWLPQDQPAQIVAGKTTTSSFWVTNTSTAPIDVRIDPAVALPGDDGQLDVQPGQDPRLTSTTFTPNRFTLAPDQTIKVIATIVAPVDLPPGTYLIPALVEPDDPATEGNIQIRRSIVALNTFQLPGPIETNVSTSLAIVDAPGSLVRTLPLLPPVVVGDAGRIVLHVQSDSSAGLYAYYETIATLAGVGALTFVGHTEGAPDDIRGAPVLYFPGTSRDHDLDWTAVPLAVGGVSVSATVSFNPDPRTTETETATASFIIVSPWWLVVIAVLAGIALLRAAFGTRRAMRAAQARRAAPGGRASRRAELRQSPPPALAIIGTIVLGVLGLAAGLLSDRLVLAGVGVGLLALLLPTAILLGRRRPAGLAPAFWLSMVGVLLALATIALVVTSALLAWSPAWALVAAAGAAAWAITAIWIGRAATSAGRDAEVAPAAGMV